MTILLKPLEEEGDQKACCSGPVELGRSGISVVSVWYGGDGEGTGFIETLLRFLLTLGIELESAGEPALVDSVGLRG